MSKIRALLAAAALVLAGCSAGRPDASTSAAVAPTVVLRYASAYPPNHPFSRADIAWIKHVEALSKGRLHIEPFWGGTLISSDEATLELAHGVADIALITPIYNRAGMQAVKAQAGFYAGATTPAEQVSVYRCLEKSFPVLDEELGGVRVLALQGGNLLNLLTRDKPVTRLDGLQGLRIRTPTEIAPLLRTLGADPVTMPMAEVYSALSKGVIDGVVAPADTLKALHFSEVAPYLDQLTIPRGAYPARAISLRAWARVPADLQAVLIQSQTFWQDQLNQSVTQAEKAGIAYGRKQGEHFIDVLPEAQSRFDQMYEQASLTQARAVSKPGFDGVRMFHDAQEDIARLRSGHPAC